MHLSSSLLLRPAFASRCLFLVLVVTLASCGGDSAADSPAAQPAAEGYDGVAPQSYAVRGLPHNVLIDRDGVIVAKNLHGETLESHLRERLEG